MPRLKKERYEKIIDDYLSGMTQKEVGKENSIGRDAVGNILRKFEIPIRSYTGERKSNRKWYWDFDFFKKRNPTVAYWAGFIMADGCITKAGTSASFLLDITIASIDEKHLEQCCNDVGLPKEALYHYMSKNTPIVTMRLNHSNLKDDLVPWGIEFRKSYNFHTPEISDELLPHYLRGWADGDGHIYRYGNDARFTVSGNIPSMRWYGEALKHLGYSGNFGIQMRNENTGILYIGGRLQVTEVISILNVDNEFCLERKLHNYHDSQITPHIVNCKNCGKEFTVSKHKYENPKQGKFCNRKCYQEYIRNEGKKTWGKENAVFSWDKSGGRWGAFWKDLDGTQRSTTKARWLWEMNRGKVPDGCWVTYIDEDRENCILENLKVVPRGEIMSKAMMGHVVSDETKRKLSVARTGKIISGDHKKNTIRERADRLE